MTTILYAESGDWRNGKAIMVLSRKPAPGNEYEADVTDCDAPYFIAVSEKKELAGAPIYAHHGLPGMDDRIHPSVFATLEKDAEPVGRVVSVKKPRFRLTAVYPDQHENFDLEAWTAAVEKYAATMKAYDFVVIERETVNGRQLMAMARR